MDRETERKREGEGEGAGEGESELRGVVESEIHPRNPGPKTRNPKPETRNSKLSSLLAAVRSEEMRSQNPGLETYLDASTDSIPGFVIWVFGIRVWGLGFRDWRRWFQVSVARPSSTRVQPETCFCNPKPKLKTRGPKPETP